MRWKLALEEDPTLFESEVAADSPPDTPPDDAVERFRGVLLVEEAWSGDNRLIQQDATTWRDLPLPMMGLVETTQGHEQAVLVGHIDTIERDGALIRFGGVWSNSDEAMTIRSEIDDGHLRGVSADMDDIEWELLVDMGPADEAADQAEAPVEDVELEPTEVVDGDAVAVLDMPNDRMRVTRARVMGATIVPFPAFQECFIENDVAVTAGAIPIQPPHGWFSDPSFDRVVPWTVTDQGEVYGHLAAWDSCHIGMPGCRQPPRTKSNYAHFLTGEVKCSKGERVPVGQICLKGGHADRSLPAREAVAHYDDTRSAFCDVRVGEDAYGIWVHGALRPGLDPASVRVAMAHDISGDWRWIGGTLELIGICSVNVPGFNKPRVSGYTHEGLVASVQFAYPLVAYQRSEALQKRAVERIAASIGRSTVQRRAALRARVHGGADGEVR